MRPLARLTFLSTLAVLLVLGPAADAGTRKARSFTATAYAIAGRTASGIHTRPGVVAADPSVLPLGSRIRVAGAGPYSGDYLVADTGGAVQGRKIDIYIPNEAEALRFGRRRVRVEVLE